MEIKFKTKKFGYNLDKLQQENWEICGSHSFNLFMQSFKIIAELANSHNGNSKEILRTLKNSLG